MTQKFGIASLQVSRWTVLIGPSPQMKRTWINRTVWGIVLATFFSDVSHEMTTAVLPEFIKSVGLGAMALGLIEGLADFLVSLSKLAGGVLGHHVQHKKPWTVVGYLVTTVCTSAIGLTRTLRAMVTLRTIAWAGRGYRSPLRDYLLADAVEKTHYGRAFGLERAGDMLGAVAGPLFAAAMVWWHVPLGNIILCGIVPGLLAVSAMAFISREAQAACIQLNLLPWGEGRVRRNRDDIDFPGSSGYCWSVCCYLAWEIFHALF